MLKATKLACRRGNHLLFRDIDFSLAPGEMLLVKGRNGSGKSSLLRMLAGLLPVYDGVIDWNGASMGAFTDHRARLHYLGHLNAVKPELTVRAAINYWRALLGQKGARDVPDIFGLAGLHDRQVRTLSAGQKRRLALTRLLLEERDLWLLDEPATALDDDGQNLLSELIVQHRARGGLTIIATHQSADFKNAKQLMLGGQA